MFGIHGVGQIIGAITTGVFNAKALVGIDYSTMLVGGQVCPQFLAVSMTFIWRGIDWPALYKLVDQRLTVEAERQGIDLTSHGKKVSYHS